MGLPRPRDVSLVLLGQQEAGRVHIAAGDVRMNVNTACHHDTTRKVDGLRCPAAGRWKAHAVAIDPEVADAVEPVNGIDQMTTLETDHRGVAPATACSDTAERTSAALGAGLGRSAGTVTRAPAASL